MDKITLYSDEDLVIFYETGIRGDEFINNQIRFLFTRTLIDDNYLLNLFLLIDEFKDNLLLLSKKE